MEDNKINTEDKKKSVWYFRPWIIATVILSVGPLGLILLWVRPKTSLRLKISISAIVIILTIFMTIKSVEYYQILSLHYQELAEMVRSI